MIFVVFPGCSTVHLNDSAAAFYVDQLLQEQVSLEMNRQWHLFDFGPPVVFFLLFQSQMGYPTCLLKCQIFLSLKVRSKCEINMITGIGFFWFLKQIK